LKPERAPCQPQRYRNRRRDPGQQNQHWVGAAEAERRTAIVQQGQGDTERRNLAAVR